MSNCQSQPENQLLGYIRPIKEADMSLHASRLSSETLSLSLARTKVSDTLNFLSVESSQSREHVHVVSVLNDGHDVVETLTARVCGRLAEP